MPSTATIAAPLSGTAGCNSAGAHPEDENAVRSLSADSCASADGGSNVSAGRVPDLRPGV